MSNPILVKRSAVPGKIPTPAQLDEGSIAMNTADKRMFFSAGNIITLLANVSDITWNNLAGKPTTIGGLGLTDAYTKTEVNSALTEKVSSSLIGANSGVASLDATGKVPSTQLPSYVDDVIEAATQATFPGTGETGKMYVALNTNKIYRWSGTVYVEISGSPGSTDAVVEGTTNLYFTAARAIAAVTSVSGNAGTATKLATARNISMTGDVTWNVSFDGSANATAVGTLANVVVAGTSPKVTYNAKGLVTGGEALVAADIPDLDWSKITTGTPTTLSGYGIIDSDLAACSLRRTTTQALTTTAVDITFNTVDFANATSVLVQGSPTSRLVALVAGTYFIKFECESINTTNANLDLYQIKKNGVAVPNGLTTVNCRSSRMKVSDAIVLTLAANDYITVAASSNTGTTGTMQIGASLTMIRMQGSAGQDGAQGPQGAAGAPGGQLSVYYSAANLDNPSNANWAVNALAPATADTVNAGLTVRAFDDTAEEGVGMTIYVPPGMTNVILTMTGKCATAPASARAVVPKLYARSINIGSAVGTWNAGVVMTALAIQTNNFYQSYQQTFTLASLGLTAGNSGQLELTRLGSNAGDTLVGDFHLLNLTVAFS